MKSSPTFQIFSNIDNVNYSNTFENLKSIYHYSIPNTKLFYPEPFVASPSFMHSDLWFVHILLYQYWLWFVFIFIIVFFFLTFLTTIRWCNMRVRPRRETRGVSRSKCGDLITATVPVSWATSIIVNESTDAIDYYDGFGTTELVIGIRAYQWGWEYYYPKDIDLNYNLKPNHSIFVGNSLKYQKTTNTANQANNFWKFYQNKAFDASVTPLFFLLSSFDNNKILNFLNLNDIGLNPLFETNSFKKIKNISKTFVNQLVFSSSIETNAYHMLSNIYINSLKYSTSYSYGSQKQQNFSSQSAIFNNQTTLLNSKPLVQLLSANYGISKIKKNSFKHYTVPSSSLDKPQLSSFLINILENTHSMENFMILKNFLFLKNYCQLNTNSDQKLVTQPMLKVFNSKINNSLNSASVNILNKLTFFSEITTPTIPAKNFAPSNSSVNLKFKKFSAALSQNLGTSEKTIRTFSKKSPLKPSLNHSNNSNTLAQTLDLTYSQNQLLTNSSIFMLPSNMGSNSMEITKNLLNKISPDLPYTPILTAKTNKFLLNYDKILTNNADTSLVLQGKEEFMPVNILSIYWNFFFNNSNINLKINQTNRLASHTTIFYLPTFALYYDYDFRNWQASELFENSFWETIYPMNNQWQNNNLKQKNDTYSFDITEKWFNYKNRVKAFKQTANSNRFPTNSFNFSIDDYFLNTKLTLSSSLGVVILNHLFNLNSDSYNTVKSENALPLKFNKFSLPTYFSFLTNHSFSTVFDSFRSDFYDSSLFSDNVSNLQHDNSFNLYFFLQNNTYVSNNSNIGVSAQHNSNNLKFLNNINLRNTAKNAIVTYNSMQKVFKTRFDENRAHSRYADLTSSKTNLAFLSAPKIPYETMLGKNKLSFLNINLYKTIFKTNFNLFYDVNTSLNFAFYDFPFLLAFKSDSARYLWFDWFAKWGYVEIQPSSSSRYAAFGMPYFSKNFEFSTSANENLNETENYLIRISRARKNYLPTWTYAPYLYLKNTIWFKNDLIFYINTIPLQNPLTRSFFFLNLSSWYWNATFINYSSSVRFSSSNSNSTSFARTAVFNNTGSHGYYFLLTNLADILTKREYLYRELFFNKHKLINMDLIFTNSPKNALFFEIKTFLNLNTNNSLNYNKEYSRNSSNFSFAVFSDYYFKNLFFSSYVSFIDDLFVNYFNYLVDVKLNQNPELYKNQYRPMRKGVSNMIRLHATGAVALPIEIRLQVLASSKDVIHSWAIPSAGIKIDCVPGYSSHRVMIFLVAGIYWGQCMEICGRYHHWMPIIVYFVKRDLFFLWCTHFIHTSPTAVWNANDRQFIFSAKPVSFDKTSWLLELNK